MANYNESAVIATKWQRCVQIQIRNYYNGPKQAVFHEESLLDFGNGNIIYEPLGTILEPFSDPTKIINLINPETGDSLNQTVTYQDVYVILHSLYLQLAAARDAELASPAP